MLMNLMKSPSILSAERFILLLGLSCLVSGATHDELPQCSLSGVYKTRQSVVESPNYPNNYPISTCWDYVIRSPYRCPTKFHIQFLDFHLESSANCTNDYLAIGVENDGDDMDLLCGQVIGIKKYHTPGGILRLRFFSDSSPWTTARGFKLLITRLACEREDYLRENLDTNDEDTEEVLAPSSNFQPPQAIVPQLFRNWTQVEQHIPYPTAPLFGWNLPAPPPPAFGNLYGPQPNPQFNQLTENVKPCKPEPTFVSPYPGYIGYPALAYRSNNLQKPVSADQYVGDWQSDAQSKQLREDQEQTLKTKSLVKPTGESQPRQQFFGAALPGAQLAGLPPTGLPPLNAPFGGVPFGAAQPPVLQDGSALFDNTQAVGSTASSQQCCTTSFHQKRFYLSSPGFPRTAFTSLLPTQQRDCQFGLEKNADNICRLRIQFKFFDFGQTYVGTGATEGNINVAISTSRDVCTEDFIEINGERFCGCRTGYVYRSAWGLGAKHIRMRMGYSGVPSSGFLLEIYQEECQETAFVQPQLPAHDVPTNVVSRPSVVQGQVGIGQQNAISNQNVNNRLQQNVFGQQQLPVYQQSPLFAQPPQTQLPPDQIPYRPLQTPSLNLFLATQQPQFWPPPTQPPYAGLPSPFPPSFGVPLYRNARTSESLAAASTHQPMTVVETNSTRKEYYYFDGDEAFGRLRANDEPDDADRNGIAPSPAVRDRCSFSTMDALRLTVDTLWITKPTCYAPLRSWFSNIFG
ncbi:uncharacterized protein LOC105218215 [Zeugodacus cucurbitae]|uniref:uncharacterized protein LOC105218215 n=1 Tax=Zeugodacus cucurbitae TaxID=28588 RepID=UPI0023D94541|nr:uncharacterized protein LOC105218215 [Zeugodacus cucurbitae]